MRIEPRKIIKKYKETGSVCATAEALGVSRMTVYRWLLRARSPYPYGNPRYMMKGLKRKSTRPKKVRESVLSGEEKVRIMALRGETGMCAERMVALLDMRVAPKTVERFLKRRGVLRSVKRHRRPLCQNTVHMHAKNADTTGYLQMDVKFLTPELTGLPWTCFSFAVMDIYSRYKDAEIYNHLNQDNAIAALTTVVSRLPFRPVFLQTDNGLEFQQRFSQHAVALCGRHHYIHKSSPNENAVIERSFRTDEEEFIYYKAPFKDYDDLREQYTEWLHWYNHTRPHLGIDLKTPIFMIQSVTNVVSD